MAKRPGKSKSLHPYPGKSPLKSQDPSIYEDMQFRWRVTEKYIDYDDEEWGWGRGRIGIRQFFQRLLPRLHQYETMTWNELFNRQSCHAWKVNDMYTDAQRKLREKYPEHDTFHQIDMEQPCRLLGIRDRQILHLIWHDPNHTICPQ